MYNRITPETENYPENDIEDELSEYDGFEDYENERTQEENTAVQKSRSHPLQLLILIQAGICVLAVGAGLLLKFIGGELYAGAANAYFSEYNNSVFPSGKEESTILNDNAQISETSKITADEDESAGIIRELKKNAAPPLENGVLTSPFGKRKNGDKTEDHKGVDIASEKGSPVFAVTEGEIITAENDPSYGNYIVISHKDGVKTLYAHCDSLCVQKGDKVSAGQKIALVGETGDADGAHLHFELIIGGNNKDPMLILGDEYK